MIIVGAGLSGLIAAHMFPRAIVKEQAPGPLENHRALLRFRTEVVSHVTHIPFRKVTVRKGIYHEGAFVPPTIALANRYTRKCLGVLDGRRSIWNLDPVTRYIAPEDFITRLTAQVGDRISWGESWDPKQRTAEAVVSTAPLPVTLAALDIPGCDLTFNKRQITVRRYRLADSDVHQTVYFPTDLHSLYRASITGDLLILEFVGAPDGYWEEDLLAAFGLSVFDMSDPGGEFKQTFGKIQDIDNAHRRALIGKLSEHHGIYSLGRFATWRNILLDDVVQDCRRISSLISASAYERMLARAR